MCPFCNVPLEYKTATSKEPHGEIFEDSWYSCPTCYGMYEVDEIEGYGHGV